jgi:hypothetical protein
MVPMSLSRRPGGRRTPRIHRPSVLALEGRTLLTASPRIDQFAVPTSSSLGNLIVDGPDGDLWFSEGSSLGGSPDTIDRITPQGQVTEIQLQLPSGELSPYLSA